MPPTPKVRRGFSLIEILIVIMLISMSAYFIQPSIKKMFMAMEARHAQWFYQDGFAWAQQQANLRNASLLFCAYTPQGSCGKNWSKGFLILQGSALQKDMHRLKSEALTLKWGVIKVRSFPNYRDYILFNPTSLFPSDNATLWYCSVLTNKPQFALRLNQFGQAQVIKPNKKGEIVDEQNNVLIC